jgi:hypothetical protein
MRMRGRFLLGFAVLALTLGGCAASQAHDARIDTSDPSWTPPGQGELAIGADPEPKSKPKAKKARHLVEPNHRETPAQGLHATNP